MICRYLGMEICMELTERHIEVIKAAAREISYGSITINISDTADHVVIEVCKRIRLPKEPAKALRRKAKITRRRMKYK